MSVTGKSTQSIRKQEVSQSRLINLGFSNVRALHQATLNQTVIQLASLTTPTGVTNYSAPNVSLLTSTNLLLLQNNVRVNSSISGPLMMNLSYVISGASTIKLLYSARENEIFEIIIDQSPRTSTTLADAAPLVSTGTLLATTQDYNVGTPYAVGKYLTYQHGSVMVFLDNQLQYRNTGNNAPGAGVTGDYYEVLAGSGLGTLIRFNTIDPINDRAVSVVSIGSLVEKPSASQLAVMEALQGQIDAIVPTLASLAEVPETNFQATPNNTDLKAFGDRVLTAEGTLTSQGTRITNLELGPSITTVTTTGGGTYTVPAGTKWLRIRMSAAGGGGGGGGATGSAGTSGGNSTFTGAAQIASCTGGAGGAGGISGGATGPDGGTASVSLPGLQVVAFQGGGGCGANNNADSGGFFSFAQGGAGGANPFGCAGKAGAAGGGIGGDLTGQKTGAGGGGGGQNTAAGGSSGCGGSAGGYVEFTIPGSALLSSYTYSLGVGGTKGTASGANGNGGNGADGILIVEAYF